MSTESTTPAAATPDQGSQTNPTPLQQSNPQVDAGVKQDAAKTDTAPKADQATDPAKTDAKADANKEPDGLLFAKKDDEKPKTADDIRKFLKEKGLDDKSLEGKTDDELQKMFDEASKEGEKVTDFKFEDLKIPEDMHVSEDMKGELGKLATVFKDEKLTDSQKMQAAIDLHVKAQQKNADFWNETKAGWRKQVEEDKELGGANLKQTVAKAESVIQKFGGTPDQIKEMQDDLILLGLGNKRSFIRFCNNIARATSEDSMDGTTMATKKDDKSLATKMWPNMPS